MKRAFPQKVKPVPSCVAEDTVVGQPKQALPEVNRRARTSAAMIGLAISMGAHSMLIAHQTDEAIAAEPTGESTVTADPLDVAALSSETEVTPSAESLAVSGTSVIEYTVQEGQTLWQLAQFYGVDATKVAALNEVPINSVLHVGQVLKIPVSNRVPAETGSERLAGPTSKPSSITASNLPVAVPSTSPDQDVALKAKQDAALDRLKQKREDLKLSLTKLKTDRTDRQDSQTITATAALSEHQADAYEASNVSTYRVVPGDTLTEIARSYGISPANLVAANKLGNPDVIRVNQVLVIPQAAVGAQQSTLGVEVPTRSKTTVAMLPTAVASDVPIITADTKPNSVMVPVGQASQPEFKARIASLPEQATSAKNLKHENSLGETTVENSSQREEAAIATAPFVSSPPPADGSASNLSYSYVENLRQEILKLREKYRTSSSSQLQIGSHPTSKVAAITLTSASSDTGSASGEINPEFNPRGYADSLRGQIRNLQAKTQGRAIEVPVAPANSRPVASRATSASKSESQLVATASIGSQNYEPLTQSSLGQMVTPDLPPLGAVENYLPGNSGKFNGYMWPAKGLLTSGYGWRWGRMHKGIDIAAPIGTPVMAAASGVVVTAGWNSGGYGNLVEIKHPDGSLTLYAHNNRVLVREGQQVEQGQQIAEMGSTGYSTGPHCHFEVHPAGQGAMNPMAFLPRVS